ncbi:formate/nitrite transporter family protein [Anaerosphaera multitolerans]|uniref:Formate/nitrite transporter family protein n=1 Tax=Anaerosphaera multitolerans TaxID=2487351 RepID=A0A437S5T3_9FIRM|nr:formate/nitrite transporter family protein [Anaerosphaera multitolerans]RVU54385.1 formate/nitrite transporter family protein [Anaerosphaera multitolerans]
MECNSLREVALSAKRKYNFFQNKSKYFIYSLFAGAYCSIGMALAYNAAAGFYSVPALRGIVNLIMGITFALSFTLIVFAGAELFTGNIFVLNTGTLFREVSFNNTFKILIFCYFGNILGASIMGVIISLSGAMGGTVADMLKEFCQSKVSFPPIQLIFKGIMCNVLVCLGTWMTYKIKSEAAKMMALLWAIVGFVTPGYEHCIANAGLFTMNAISNSIGTNYLQGIFINMTFVTLGNIIGGLLVALGYYYANCNFKNSNEQL